MLVIQRWVIWLDVLIPSLQTIWEIYFLSDREIQFTESEKYTCPNKKQIFVITENSWTFFFPRCSAQLARPFVLGDRTRCESEEKPWLWICKQRWRNSENWKFGGYFFETKEKKTVASESFVGIYLKHEIKKQWKWKFCSYFFKTDTKKEWRLKVWCSFYLQTGEKKKWKIGNQCFLFKWKVRALW